MSYPVPAPGRFKPLRSGLVELFLYEAQEFPFRDGRLLLRGDNGSGKSKVLALTLPLLLDANLNPARMEPDADPNKRMAWNLLLGDVYDERTGYSWIEFGRIDDEGREHFVTLGLGVKAVQHRGVVRQWWFVTEQRIGHELHLVDRSRTVRTRDRLIEAIGDRGAVFDTAERYRRAVDESLFGLHGRYDALIDLLVHLRQPQLSKRPNEKQLARALSESLAPMPESLIETVAQSYQALEDDERAIQTLRSTAGAVRTFAGEYARYARIAALRATAQPRRAQSDYEGQARRSREATARLERAVEALTRAEDAVDKAENKRAGLDGSREALRERRGSDEIAQYQNARDVADAKRRAALAAEGAAAQALATRNAQQRLLDEARAEAEEERAGVADAHAAAGKHAGIASIDLSPVPDGLDAAVADRIARELDAGVRRRREHVAHLDRVITARDAAAAAHQSARQAVDAAAARRDVEDERMRAAQDAAERAASEWLESASGHLTNARLLRGEGLDEAFEAAGNWAAAPDDAPNPLRQWANVTARARGTELEEKHIAADHELRRLDPFLADLDSEIERLAAGVVRVPPPPATRTADREESAGAAFWECVDPRPRLAAAEAAGIEAALQASGLLDAWVDAAGVAASADGDVLLRPAPQDGSTLADVLLPLEVRGIAADRVDALLRSIALVDDPREGQAAVSTTGAFALGPLVGAWRKPAAEYLGATARERARLARLEEARAEHERLTAERIEWTARVESAQERRTALAEERDGLPVDAPVRRTSDAAAAAAERRAEQDAELGRHRDDLAGAAERLQRAEVVVAEASELTGIDPDALEQVRRALAGLPDAAGRLVERIRRLVRCEERAAERGSALRETEESLARAEAAAQEATAYAVTAEHRRDMLEATVGEEAREIERRLSEVEAQLEQIKFRLGTLRGERDAASTERAVAQHEVETVAGALALATEARDEAAESFRLFAETGLLALAVSELDIPDPATQWAPDPTVRLARRALEALGGQDPSGEEWDAAVGRLRRAFETMQAELSTRGRQSAWDQRHAVTVVTVQHGSEYVVPMQLGEELEAELAERGRLLTAKERAILETHLIDEVGAQLHERVRTAMDQVTSINAELARRPTRSGLKLRIVWEPADGELDREGRALLQQSAAAWSPADRDAIGEYLRARVEDARREDPEASWHERLGRAFDYRAWNTFAVQLHQGRGWRPASGPASSGERVLAGSVPLFAAAASHYASTASPYAPRIVLLDEAFAGVDDRSRANYLGLLAEFDLDVVMTSEREWATYPEIPGIAIANLFRLPGTEAVHVEHWTWDGSSRERLADPGATAIEPAPTAEPDGSALALDFDELS
ncbi:TIGR02680 family protein [Leucobacter sp. wl10]|uniref:TIGR02680 family protein n=1 Tax=Leucobacter sp. wl10 TaxID=2304677 RepID=UPI000E5A5001|nr:TIGR02680 family protein [Leucobacter sp. wl10]RGE19250.1 TIGR02680 family protein [Leucobacter sp. wl10]